MLARGYPPARNGWGIPSGFPVVPGDKSHRCQVSSRYLSSGRWSAAPSPKHTSQSTIPCQLCCLPPSHHNWMSAKETGDTLVTSGFSYLIWGVTNQVITKKPWKVQQPLRAEQLVTSGYEPGDIHLVSLTLLPTMVTPAISPHLQASIRAPGAVRRRTSRRPACRVHGRRGPAP